MVDSVVHSNQTTRFIQFPVQTLDRVLGKYGFEPVNADAVEPFHTLADELIDGEIADIESIARVQRWTGRSLHLRYKKGRPDALLASIPLSSAGRDAILDGRFGFANARREWVCGLDERAAALLSWGMAGRTPLAQVAALRGLLAGWYHFYSDVRVYARARSLQGQALMKRLRFESLGSPDGSAPLWASTRFPAGIARRLGAMRLADQPTTPEQEVSV
ncbi:hypothetical protein [Maricaulis sp.]|uniref:hypothetical protein n=1 Tax=Maricaulis sp. TaxID=1486257 RepID=UPI00260C142F|nr:hypothetical protein [Maricaulis sp.]